jgi:hypothetical protein
MLANLAYDFLKDKTQTQFMTLLHILSMCMRRFNAVSFVCVWFGAGVAVCGRVVDSGLCGILARVYDLFLLKE